MSDDRVREIRERLARVRASKYVFTRGGKYHPALGISRADGCEMNSRDLGDIADLAGDVEALLAELERALVVVEAAEAFVEATWQCQPGHDEYEALQLAIHQRRSPECACARSPELAGGTKVADADEG